MGYYLRAFCTSPAVPALAEVLAWTRQQGTALTIDPETSKSDWGRDVVGFLYKAGKLPFHVEIYRYEADDSLCADEIDEFAEMLVDVPRSKYRDQVMQHLKQTQFIVACQLPSSDIDDDGFEAAGSFLQYFIDNCNGIIQADGEGFYEGDELVVEME